MPVVFRVTAASSTCMLGKGTFGQDIAMQKLGGSQGCFLKSRVNFRDYIFILLLCLAE